MDTKLVPTPNIDLKKNRFVKKTSLQGKENNIESFQYPLEKMKPFSKKEKKKRHRRNRHEIVVAKNRYMQLDETGILINKMSIEDFEKKRIPQDFCSWLAYHGITIVATAQSDGSLNLGYIIDPIRIPYLQKIPPIGSYNVEHDLERKEKSKPLSIYPNIDEEKYNWKFLNNYNLEPESAWIPDNFMLAKDNIMIQSDFTIAPIDHILLKRYGLLHGFDYNKRPKIKLVDLFKEPLLPHKLLSLAVILQIGSSVIISRRSQRPRKNLPDIDLYKQYYYGYALNEPKFYDVCLQDIPEAIPTFKRVMGEKYNLFVELAKKLNLDNKTSTIEVPKEDILDPEDIPEIRKQVYALINPNWHKSYSSDFEEEFNFNINTLFKYKSARITPRYINLLSEKVETIYFACRLSMYGLNSDVFEKETRRLYTEMIKVRIIQVLRKGSYK